MFANGPHAGTQAFEVGDPSLDNERSLGVEASIKRTAGPVRLTATAYFSRFSNFIFQAATGEIEDDLPVYAYRQGRAKYYGFEFEADAKLGNAMGVNWGFEAVADATRATIKGFGPAPQVPPLRLLGALTGERGPFDGKVEVERVFAQNRTAPLETETPGYTLLNASIDWHPLSNRPELTLGACREQHLRRRRPPPRQHPQRLRPACRAGYPPVRSVRVLGGSLRTIADIVGCCSTCQATGRGRPWKSSIM